MESRRGFTLIELLIVTVVIATLMGVVFRLAGVGGDSRARSETLMKLQRVENALSGYHAAFGSYPPVPVHGTRDLSAKVDGLGIQSSSESQNLNLSGLTDDNWRQVEAACRAQPVAVHFPFNSNSNRDREFVATFSREKNRDVTIIDNIGSLVGKGPKWMDVQVFKFGLLSFLLPRYEFMLNGSDPLLYDGLRQWKENNTLPARVTNGKRWETWEKLRDATGKGMGDGYVADKGKKRFLTALASQAACARWMPNLEGIVSGGREFFGINTADGRHNFFEVDLNKNPTQVGIYSPDGYDGSGAEYLQDGMTIKDGWGNELFYYSPFPHQSYRLWSSGPDGKTFPPWVDLDKLNEGERNKVYAWTRDDMMHLEHKGSGD